MPDNPAHPMRMQKLGGRMQLVIDDAHDLARVLELDESLWAATSAPVDGLNCDQVFLGYVDFDANGRIRADEIKAAITWLLKILGGHGRLGQEQAAVCLDDIDASHPEGKSLRAAAERILTNLGIEHAGEPCLITLDQVRSRQKILASATANGDGVIPPEAIADQELAGFIRDIIACMGGKADASGPQGVTTEILDGFLAETRAFLQWSAQSESSAIMIWGEDTAAAFAAYSALAEKLEHFFALCAVSRIDPAAAEQAWGIAADSQALCATATMREKLLAAPLAKPNPEEKLDLRNNINPAFRKAMAGFREAVMPRIKPGEADCLNLREWEELKRALAPYRAWQAQKAGGRVEKLGTETLRAYQQSDLPARLRELIRTDLAAAAELGEIQNLEKLLLFQRWLPELANNFVSFPRLYDPKQTSLVQVGTLILDGRKFTLTVKVTDRKAHKKIAAESHICLLYLEITGRQKDRDRKFEVAAAVTAGTTSTLWTGKRGIFFTPDNEEYDAIVVDVLENPVGLWEAVKQPFKRLAEFAGKQAERFTSSRYSDIEKRIDKSVTEAGKNIDKQVQKGPAVSPAATAAANRTRAGTVRDLLMGGSVAVAALGGTFALITKTIAEVDALMVLRVLVALVLIVAVPTLVVAMVKLRRRNLATLLEACGWAMNGKLTLTAGIGALFTRIPRLPAGCKRGRMDQAKRQAVHLDREQAGSIDPADLAIWVLLLLLALGAVLVWVPWIISAVIHR